MTQKEYEYYTTLSSEWVDYDGDYKKVVQDIELYDGRVFTCCWPNAGKFHTMSMDKQEPISQDQVKRVKAHKKKDI